MEEPEIILTEKEEMDAIAKKHGLVSIYKMMVPVGDTEEIATGYFRRPTRQEFGAALSIMDKNPLRAKEIILGACWLEGDKRILEDDHTFINACTRVDDIIYIQEAALKKN